MDKGGLARLGVSSPAAGRRSRPAIVGGRAVGLFMLCCGVGSLLAYMTIRVPVVTSKLPASEVHRHWLAAVVAVLVVVAVDQVLIWIQIGRGENRTASVAAIR